MDEPQHSPSVQGNVEIGYHAQIELQSVGKCRLAGWIRREMLTNELGNFGVTGQNNAAYSVEDKLPSYWRLTACQAAPSFVAYEQPHEPAGCAGSNPSTG